MVHISPKNTEETALKNIMTPKLREDLDSALDSLSQRRRDIFLSHYVEGTTYHDLSIHYGLTEERVKQITRLTRNQLRRITSLRQYLDMIS